jgi:hypothetical protein
VVTALGIIVFLFSALFEPDNEIQFDRFFYDQTLRIDYYHAGNALDEYIIPDNMYIQGKWAGNTVNLVASYRLGKYSAKVYDLLTNRLIFSIGYSTIFSEYQATDPANNGVSRTYHESVLIPRPKSKCLFVIEKRDRYNIPVPVYQQVINPDDYHINTESNARNSDEIISLVSNGDPHHAVDLVIVGEGYTRQERNSFRKDLEYFTRVLFSTEPFASQQKKFNISGIFTPSAESGTDEPRQGKYRNTALGSSFNIFDTDRYLLADDNKTIRDIAGQVPYDIIMVMVNSGRYGGGGIFNWQTTFTSGSPYRDHVFLHEFGHAFAGLGDEYYTSDVSYKDFYPEGIEPLDPNVTALPDPQNLRWKDLVSPGLKIPTEWGKELFDSLNNAMGIISREKEDGLKQLFSSGACEEAVKSHENIYNTRLIKLQTSLDSFLINHPLKGKVGAFEGAGYQKEGLYRPTLNSIMHRFDPDDRSFGKVNERAIMEMTEHYSE